METKKKLLIMVDWFAPGYKAGGPIQSSVNLAFALKKHFDVYVLTTDTDHGEANPYPGIQADKWTNDLDPDIRVFYAAKQRLNTKVLKKHILEARPDIVYLNHLFSPLFVLLPLWLHYTGQMKSAMVVCPRGALYSSALAVKSWKKTPVLWLMRCMGLSRRVLFHATNEREQTAILDYFPGSEVLIADNLPNSRQPAFSVIPKEKGSVKCIFIARIHPIKNLLFLLKALSHVRSQVLLTIIGPVEDENYWEKCQAQIAVLPGNISVNYVGAKPNHELIAFLQRHHLFILPTTGENFGHAIFESFLTGRPVLISDQTPWLRLEEQCTGWDLPLNNAEAFTATIEAAAAWDQQVFDQWSRAAWQYAKKFIENPRLKQQYLHLFS